MIVETNNLFLYIEGVSGPVAHKDYGGWVRLLGMNEEILSSSGPTGGSAVPAQTRPLTVMKPIDSASVPLRRAAVSGQHIPLAAVAFAGSSSEQAELFRLVLENVSVTRLRTSVREGKVVEEADLSFERVRWQFNVFMGTGQSAGTLTGCWDYKASQAC